MHLETVVATKNLLLAKMIACKWQEEYILLQLWLIPFFLFVTVSVVNRPMVGLIKRTHLNPHVTGFHLYFKPNG